MTAITRRRALGLSAATAAGALLPAAWSGRGAAAGRLENLVLWGPPAGPSIALAHLVRHGESRRQVGDLSFKVWRTPDQMRAGFVSGDIRISGIPSYVGANLYNKGLPVRMVNIMTWGVLYLLSADDGVSTLADIAGRTVTMPFRNDMPDLVFRYITAKAGL
ncbi:MAG: ABC transporter substrate-binding protein, partial [Rhodobacterales bacterium]|nr:ABC transporter substrate-binding protein [Rhodobacterales bacterium]